METQLETPTSTEEVAGPKYILIKGQTTDGKKFRPSDWADRLMGCISLYTKEEKDKFDEIRDCICSTERDGFRGIVFEEKLIELVPMLYRFLNNFAKDNSLVVEVLENEDWNAERQRVVVKPKRSFS